MIESTRPVTEAEDKAVADRWRNTETVTLTHAEIDHILVARGVAANEFGTDPLDDVLFAKLDPLTREGDDLSKIAMPQHHGVSAAERERLMVKHGYREDGPPWEVRSQPTPDTERTQP